MKLRENNNQPDKIDHACAFAPRPTAHYCPRAEAAGSPLARAVPGCAPVGLGRGVGSAPRPQSSLLLLAETPRIAMGPRSAMSRERESLTCAAPSRLAHCRRTHRSRAPHPPVCLSHRTRAASVYLPARPLRRRMPRPAAAVAGASTDSGPFARPPHAGSTRSRSTKSRPHPPPRPSPVRFAPRAASLSAQMRSISTKARD